MGYIAISQIAEDLEKSLQAAIDSQYGGIREYAVRNVYPIYKELATESDVLNTELCEIFDDFHDWFVLQQAPRSGRQLK